MANSKKGFSMSFKPKSSASSRARDERTSAGPPLSSAIDQDHPADAAASNRDYVIGFGEGKVVTKEARVERGPRVIPIAEKPWKPVVAVSEATAPKRESGASKIDASTTSNTTAAFRDIGGRTSTTAEEKSLDELAAEAIARESREAMNGKLLLGGASSSGIGGDSSSARVIGMAGRPSGGGSNNDPSAGVKRVGLLEQNMIPGLAEVKGDDAKFKHDLGHRAEDVSVRSQAYEETPVTEFGAALLRGMGWQGPQGNAKGAEADLVKDVEPRHHRLGLGAQPKPPEEMKKPRKRKPGEKARPLDEKRLKIWEQKANDERARASRRRAHEISVMDVVEIARGRSVGGERQRAMVLKTQGVPGLNKISVRMEGTGEKVFVERSGVIRVSEDDLARQPFDDTKSHAKEGSDRDHKDGESNGRKSLKRSRSRSRSRSSNRDEDRDGGKTRKRSKKDKKKHKKASHSSSQRRSAERGRSDASPTQERRRDRIESNGSRGGRDRTDERGRGGKSVSEQAWLRANIRVRVIHKSYAGGRAYLGKGRVVDVPRVGEATVRMDLGDLVLEGVKQRHMETVLPSRGGKVIVVRGQEKGLTGKLLAKDKEAETALVQVYDDLRAIRLSLDDVAEFTGMFDQDVEDLGY